MLCENKDDDNTDNDVKSNDEDVVTIIIPNLNNEFLENNISIDSTFQDTITITLPKLTDLHTMTDVPTIIMTDVPTITITLLKITDITTITLPNISNDSTMIEDVLTITLPKLTNNDSENNTNVKDDFIITFGKHKGVKISELSSIDQRYIDWLKIQKRRTSLAMNKCIDYVNNVKSKNYIYILSLEDECYYIGRTYNVKKRFQQHLSGEGAVWTELHRPIKIIFSTEMLNDEDEDNFT